ncbi:Imidazolonepropionase [Fodinibius sediminis]|uniref:Imidazolonepropionase n=2 Tax=Fodinibius sediminis TaxID=1214077 RepID=A0A521DAM8_9BACT|nr:Imidazolonepropionase [Fodinibius sediminis]
MVSLVMMKKKYLKAFALSGIAVFLLATTAQAQITEKAEFGKFAITNVTVHTVIDGVIEGGVVLINGEEIEFVGRNARITSDYQHIDASGKHVYPGFMDAGTQLGLQEIGAVQVTRDQAELGEFNPHVRAFTAINPSSVSIPVTRVNGVTHVVSMPVSGRLSGKATLIDLYGYTPDSMAISPNAAMHLNWPTAMKRGPHDQRSDKEVEEAYQKNIKQLNDLWERAVFYNEMMESYQEGSGDQERPEVQKKLEAMREVISGNIPVIISVDQKKDILNAIAWTEKHPKTHFILAGVQEGWRVADEIAEADLPCLVSTLYTPERDYDNYQRPYQNPAMLHKAGVKVAIATGEIENVRNAPYHAGYAATYGLGREEALKAITLNPAEIFGVDDKLGSIAKGKQANLFISDGDPFEPMTQIEQVFIRGYKIPMVSRHSQLYEEYLNRGAETN